MVDEDKVSNYLAMVAQRLEGVGFKAAYNVAHGTQRFRCVAKRASLHLEYGGLAEFFFVFAVLPSLEQNAFHEFSNLCFAYARRHKLVPFLPWLPLDSYFCFPVAIAENIDAQTASAVRMWAPRARLGSYGISVACDLSTKKLLYSLESPLRGRIYHEHFREMIREKLAP